MVSCLIEHKSLRKKDMSPSDIVIATLFYQFSIYVCVRLARRAVTLGELAAVCNAATAMVMETINLTRMKVSVCVLLQGTIWDFKLMVYYR